MADAPAGPPMQLLSRAERKRRRRVAAVLIAIVSALAIGLFLLALKAATSGSEEVNLGSTTFKVGRASTLAKRIDADDYPLLFQDLQDNSSDIYLVHVGKTHLTGWRALEAHAPDAARICQLEWNGREFRDPCNNKRYPADGAGLRRFKVNVVDGEVFVNFRQPIEPGE